MQIPHFKDLETQSHSYKQLLLFTASWKYITKRAVFILLGVLLVSEPIWAADQGSTTSSKKRKREETTGTPPSLEMDPEQKGPSHSLYLSTLAPALEPHIPVSSIVNTLVLPYLEPESFLDEILWDSSLEFFGKSTHELDGVRFLYLVGIQSTQGYEDSVNEDILKATEQAVYLSTKTSCQDMPGDIYGSIGLKSKLQELGKVMKQITRIGGESNTFRFQRDIQGRIQIFEEHYERRYKAKLLGEGKKFQDALRLVVAARLEAPSAFEKD